MAKIKENKRATDMQRNAFQLTLNNPLDKGYDHHKIKEILIMEFTTLRFFCMADEIATTGTYHTHVYVYFNSRVRFSKVKKAFPEAHIEVAHGSVQSNIDYIKKSGKWEDTDKAETSVEGTYEEYGEIPTQKGMRSDLEDVYQMIKAGYSTVDILEENNDMMLSIEKIDLVRFTLLVDKYKSHRRLDLKVIYISGATGTGKTRGVLDTHGDANVYRVSDYLHPFDAYNCEPIIAFDEFRSSLKISDMLNYADVYPVHLPARYSNKVACYTLVYIISNWKLEEQYSEVQKDNPESWKAFLRRIHEVRTYDADGTITIYDSVEKYLKRKEQFHTVTKTEWQEIPFEQEELPFKED